MNYQHTFSNSSMIADIQFNDESNELVVTFLNGRSYTYTGVQIAVYQDLIDAKSVGKHFNAIKHSLVIK